MESLVLLILAGINGSTSTTFTLGGGRGETNTSGEKYVAYCWHNVPGLQKFGKYGGNNSDNGSYVELGFKHPLILCLSYN